jgi:hypothetical protein
VKFEDNPERVRRRLARDTVALADALEAAGKAGHVKSLEHECVHLRELADRVEKGEERGLFS